MSDKIKLDDARVVCLDIFDYITEEGREPDDVFEALMQLFERAEINGIKRILVDEIEDREELLRYISGETKL
jgi:hypothetical protein